MRYFIALVAVTVVANVWDQIRLDREQRRLYPPDGIGTHYRVAMPEPS